MVREDLARLLLEQGQRDQARLLIDAAAADLIHLATANSMRPSRVFLPADRFESLAEVFTKLGATDRAADMIRWAQEASAPRPDDSPEPPPK